MEVKLPSGDYGQVFLHLVQGSGVQDIIGGQPALAGGIDPGKLVIEMVSGVGIRIDAAKQTLLRRPPRLVRGSPRHREHEIRHEGPCELPRIHDGGTRQAA